jgi:hypothetical protein
MGSLSNFAEVKMLDYVLNGVPYSPPATLYLALCTADPGEAGTGASMNEVANNHAYARKAITFGAAADRRITSNAQVNFDQITGNLGTVSHWAIVSSATYGGGDMLAYGAFNEAKVLMSGNTPRVSSGDVSIWFTTGGISNFLAHGWLDRMFRNQALSIAATYVGLATAAMSDATTGATVTEPADTEYARILVNPNSGSAPKWDLAVSGDPSYVDNASTLASATASAPWGNWEATFIATAATGGNILFYKNTAGADVQTIGTDDYVEFAAGDLVAQVS